MSWSVFNESSWKELFESQLWPGSCNTLPGEAAVSLIDSSVPPVIVLGFGGFSCVGLVKLSPKLTKIVKCSRTALQPIRMQFWLVFWLLTDCSTTEQRPDMPCRDCVLYLLMVLQSKMCEMSELLICGLLAIV